MIFTTGGAGFIGSNFVLDWLSVSDEPVINLDKLTYAGNLENLASLQDDARHTIVQGELGERNLVDALLDELRPKADGSSYATQITHIQYRLGHDQRYAIDSRKIERELSWKPAETFVTGISKTVLWYLDNSEWVANVQSGAYHEWVGKHNMMEQPHDT